MVRSLVGKHPSYYESVLQLRECSEEIVSYVEASFDKVGLVCSKKGEVRGGKDYFLSDNELTRNLGKKLQIKFGGDLKVTASLHTRKQNKDLYRVTVMFREAMFRRGDRVEFEGETWVVRSMGKDIFLQAEKAGEKKHLKYAQMRQIRKVD